MKFETLNLPRQLSSGGGEMGILLRSKSWNNLQPGEINEWPQSLLTTLNIVLSSELPMLLFWGSELICFFNDAYEPLLDMNGNSADFFGKKIKDYPKDKWHIKKSLLDQVMSGGQPVVSDDQLIPLHNNERIQNIFWTLNYISISDESGKPAGVLVICNEKKEASEDHYRELIHGLPTAIYTCDSDGYIKLYNQAAVNLWGVEPIAGQSKWCGSWKIFRPDGTSMPLDECPMAIAIKEGRVVTNQEIIVERPDGKRLNVIPHPRPIRDKTGLIIGAVNMLIDITDSKTAENKLRETENSLRKDLENEVIDRTKELYQLNESLKKSNSELTQFAYVASHDLQEPLRKIQTFASRIIQKEKQNLSENGKDYFERMQTAANRMQTLIDDLLAYSRTNTAEKIFELTDLNELLEEVKSELEQNINEKKATIIIDRLPELRIIPFQFHQLFTNLISNSLKFSKENIPPVLHISADLIPGKDIKNIEANQQQIYCRIIISDNGIGFEQEFNSRIFELFQRLHGKSEYSGTGIGLAICKKIAENHFGFITADSKPGEGATFSIFIPFAN